MTTYELNETEAAELVLAVDVQLPMQLDAESCKDAIEGLKSLLNAAYNMAQIFDSHDLANRQKAFIIMLRKSGYNYSSYKLAGA